MENAVGGARVSQKSAMNCRSGFQNQKEKVKERAKNRPTDDTKAWSLPQRRQLEMNNPAKQKRKQRKTHKKPP
jgi:hypothetical protein